MAHAVKWGIVSTANINRKLIPGAHASDKVELVGVASRDQARADAYAAEWEIPRAYGSYEALLADPEIEAVYMELGALYGQQLKQPTDAVQSYYKALDINPANFSALAGSRRSSIALAACPRTSKLRGERSIRLWNVSRA